MGISGSTGRLPVSVTVPAHQRTLLNKFFSDAVDGMSIRAYFDKFIVVQLGAEAADMQLMRAFVVLKEEGETIEVGSLEDKCCDYVTMDLRKAIFELSAPLAAAGGASEPEQTVEPGGAEPEVVDESLYISDSGDDTGSVECVKAPAARTSAKRTAKELSPTSKALKKQKTQASIGHFFGKSVLKKHGRNEQGQKVIVSAEFVEHPKVVSNFNQIALRHCMYCNMAFRHGPAHVQHEKTCSRRDARRMADVGVGLEELTMPAEDDVITGPLPDEGDNQEGGATVEEGEQLGENGGSDEAATTAESAATAPAPAASTPPAPAAALPHRKLLKDGTGFKKSGLREGMKRGTARTIYFKYEVVMYYREMQKLKEQGLCATPGNATVHHFGGITNGQVSAWAKQEAELRNALLEANHQQRPGKKKGADELVFFKSAAARRKTLHPGSRRKFAAAEAALHKLYKEKRSRGLRVNSHFLRLNMKKLVREIYGEAPAAEFKASKYWLVGFAKHYNMSTRKKTNKKNMSAEERAGKCKRWHARFRRRLKRGRQLDPVWGRWLPQDRYSLDQVYIRAC